MKYFRSTFLLQLALLLTVQVQAQDTTTTWITNDETPAAREQAALLRKVWQEEEGLWQVRDYFPEGGLRMAGSYTDPEKRIKEGLFINYAQDGSKVWEGRYANNHAVGFWKFWHANGALMEQGKYLRAATEAERDSIKQRMQKVENESRGKHWESLKDSTWEYYHENGVRSALEIYSAGVMTDAQYWNEDGTTVSPGAVVNRNAYFPGGVPGLMNFLGKNMTYPKKARNKGIQGMVVVSFLVNKDGSVSDVEVKQSVHPELDKEAMRLLKALPPWLPAMSQNRLVQARFTLPVNFRIR